MEEAVRLEFAPARHGKALFTVRSGSAAVVDFFRFNKISKRKERPA